MSKRPSQQLADLEALIDEFTAKVQALLAGDIRVNPGPPTHPAAVPAPSQPAPAALLPAPPALVVLPEKWPGIMDPAAQAYLKNCAAKVPVHPAFLEGLWRHESGNFGSKLFLTGRPKTDDDPGETPAWNPAGIKHTKFSVEQLGSLPNPYVSSPASGSLEYARFRDWRHGFAAAAIFFLQDRYAAVRATLDPYAEADAAGAAGYAENNPTWPPSVKAHIRNVLAQTGGPAFPMPDHTGASARSALSAAAIALVGHPTGADDALFQYPSGTEGGNLGCAAVVSEALYSAGLITPNQKKLSVDELEELLELLGWVDTAPADGTIPIWGATPESHGHRHVGVNVIVDGKLYAVNNHSSIRQVAQDTWPTGRSVDRVLGPKGAA